MIYGLNFGYLELNYLFVICRYVPITSRNNNHPSYARDVEVYIKYRDEINEVFTFTDYKKITVEDIYPPFGIKSAVNT